jgi:hypothetical protein
VRLWQALGAAKPGVPAPLSDAERAAAMGDEVGCYLLAATYAVAGETDQALTWLEHAVRVRGWFDYVYFTRHDPFLKSLQSHPRFQALMVEAKERYDRFDD